MNNLRTAIASYEVAISEYTTALANSKAKADKMRGPDGCKCKHCISYLETLDGQIIPSTQGVIAHIRGAIIALREMQDEES